MGLVKSVIRWREYTDNPDLVLSNFETKDLHVSQCLVRRGFHLHLSIRCAHLSFLAYLTPEELHAYVQKFPACAEHYHVQATFHDPKTDMDGMIVLDKRDHSLYIVFRGTASGRDVVTDLGFVPVGYENMEGVSVHSGMYTSLLSVREYLVNYVKGWQTQFAEVHGCGGAAAAAGEGQHHSVPHNLAAAGKVFLIGHSLGGCLASLFAPILYRECGVYAQVYTIGACPVGNDAFMNLLKDCTYTQWNVVNHLDVVPILTRPLKLGYSQFPQVAYYDGRGDLVYLSGRKFNAHMLQRLLDRMLGWKQGNQILNHLMYLGLTSRTAADTPLDQYVYCAEAQKTWLEDDDNSSNNGEDDDLSISSSCSDDDATEPCSACGKKCVACHHPIPAVVAP